LQTPHHSLTCSINAPVHVLPPRLSTLPLPLHLAVDCGRAAPADAFHSWIPHWLLSTSRTGGAAGFSRATRRACARAGASLPRGMPRARTAATLQAFPDQRLHPCFGRNGTNPAFCLSSTSFLHGLPLRAAWPLACTPLHTCYTHTMGYHTWPAAPFHPTSIGTCCFPLQGTCTHTLPLCPSCFLHSTIATVLSHLPTRTLLPTPAPAALPGCAQFFLEPFCMPPMPGASFYIMAVLSLLSYLLLQSPCMRISI